MNVILGVLDDMDWQHGADTFLFYFFYFFNKIKLRFLIEQSLNIQSFFWIAWCFTLLSWRQITQTFNNIISSNSVKTKSISGAYSGGAGPVKSIDFRGFSGPNRCWAPPLGKIKKFKPPWSNSWIHPWILYINVLCCLFFCFSELNWSKQNVVLNLTCRACYGEGMILRRKQRKRLRSSLDSTRL